MNTTTQQHELSQDLLRRLALMQHLGEDYFILESDAVEGLDAIAYEGTEEDARAQFEADIDGTEEANIDANFRVFCSNNITEIEELEADDYTIDYMVLTDSEADDAWDESLDNYLEECIYPELSGNLKNYFDDDKWKRDARYDGRGHSLSLYDGNEHEETVCDETFYIYRTN